MRFLRPKRHFHKIANIRSSIFDSLRTHITSAKVMCSPSLQQSLNHSVGLFWKHSFGGTTEEVDICEEGFQGRKLVKITWSWSFGSYIRWNSIHMIHNVAHKYTPYILYNYYTWCSTYSNVYSLIVLQWFFKVGSFRRHGKKLALKKAKLFLRWMINIERCLRLISWLALAAELTISI